MRPQALRLRIRKHSASAPQGVGDRCRRPRAAIRIESRTIRSVGDLSPKRCEDRSVNVLASYTSTRGGLPPCVIPIAHSSLPAVEETERYVVRDYYRLQSEVSPSEALHGRHSDQPLQLDERLSGGRHVKGLLGCA